MSAINSITARTQILCVIGHPIEHSMSPIMHNAAIKDLNLNYIYVSFNILPERLRDAVRGFKALNIKGINVTLPYKQTIMKYLDEIDPLAKKIGAVNTIKNDDGFLKAKNTDAIGAKRALIDAECDFSDKIVLIVGAGGAARALAFTLAEDVNKIVIVNRTEKKALKIVSDLKKSYELDLEGKKFSNKILEEEIKNADILINTTPIGMYPKINESPIPLEILHENLTVFDVIYNPLETQLIKNAKERGCKILGGLDMLVNQGALAFEWWTDKKPNKIIMRNKVVEYLGL
ncbi:MAG: shikimate dehydrogenase [Promethearchaeota archaeon]